MSNTSFTACSKFMRHGAASLLFACSVNYGGHALSQDASGDTNVEMELSGFVEPRCEFTSFNANEVDFSVETNSTIAFELYCNLAMSIDLQSKNGALLQETLAGLQGRQEAFERTYDAVLSLAEGGFRWETNSDAMQEGVSFSTGDTVVFDTNGTLAIALHSSVEGGHAGNYTDVISITLSPSLAALN